MRSAVNLPFKTKEEAEKVMRELMYLEELSKDFESPMMQHLKLNLEEKMKTHAYAVLQNPKPSEEFTWECGCGKKIDINKLYYQVIQHAWKSMLDTVNRFVEKQHNLDEKRRRTK